MNKSKPKHATRFVLFNFYHAMVNKEKLQRRYKLPQVGVLPQARFLLTAVGVDNVPAASS